MTAASTYFALLITLAMIYDAGSAFARIERSTERMLVLPLWALQGPAKLMVTLAGVLGLIGFISVLIYGFSFLRWHVVLIAGVIALFAPVTLTIVHLAPRHPITRMLYGYVLSGVCLALHFGFAR